MATPPWDTLTPLQRDLLDAFRGAEGVYLTGGAALGGYYLGHRRSHDLDLFSPDPTRLTEAAAHLAALCAARGFELSQERSFPGFVRFRVIAPGGETLVDLVHDPVPQTVALDDKPRHDGVRVDALVDIMANKLGALLGRGEVKDLVDLYFLDLDGHDPLACLPEAEKREGGLDPATLAWVLQGMEPDPSDLLLVREVDRERLTAYRDDLVQRLQRRAWPGG